MRYSCALKPALNTKTSLSFTSRPLGSLVSTRHCVPPRLAHLTQALGHQARAMRQWRKTADRCHCYSCSMVKSEASCTDGLAAPPCSSTEAAKAADSAGTRLRVGRQRPPVPKAAGSTARHRAGHHRGRQSAVRIQSVSQTDCASGGASGRQ